MEGNNTMSTKKESKLKKMRLAAGFTQEELSESSGVNIKSLASYEQSEEKLAKACVHTVMKLADCLGCTVEDLIDRKSLPKE